MSQEIKSMHFEAGRTVLVRGSQNHGFFYIVKSGTLVVSSGSKYADKELSRFEPGDTLGLVSALTTGQHLATIEASTPVELIRIPLSSLGYYLHTHPDVCLKMLSFYSLELKALDRHLVKLNQQTKWDDSPTRLYHDALHYIEIGKLQWANHALQRFVQWIGNNSDSAGHQYLRPARDKIKEINGKSLIPPSNEVHQNFGPKSIVFLENEPGIAAYIILEGSVKLFKLVRGKEFIIAVLEPGEIFGEQSLLEHKPYGASAITQEPVRLMRLSQKDFNEQSEAKVLQKMFESMARRIWFSHQRLAILRIPDPQTRLYFYLLTLCHFQKPVKSNAEGDSYMFHFSLEDLSKMCGLLKINPERLSGFLRDKNLQISRNSILIHNRDALEKMVHGHRRRKLVAKSYV